MATRIEPFEVSTPPATSIAAFQRTSLPFQDGRVDRVEIVIPPGPSGLVGFRVAHSGQSVLPYTGDRWFVVDDERLDWPIERFPTGGAWELWTYNLDVYAHAIQVWFHVTDIESLPLNRVTPVSIEPLAEAEDYDPTPEGIE